MFLRELAAHWPYFWYVAAVPQPGTFLSELAFSIDDTPKSRRPKSPRREMSVVGNEPYYVQVLLGPGAVLCERDPLVTHEQSLRRVAWIAQAIGGGGPPLPDEGPDPARSTIARQVDPEHAMAACLESVFRDIGFNVTQQQWTERVLQGTGPDDDAAIARNATAMLHSYGFVEKIVDTTQVAPAQRLASFRHTMARYRGIHAILLTQHWRAGDGEKRCVRLLGTEPVLRVMNPATGAVEVWSERELVEREVSVYFLRPADYAELYPEGVEPGEELPAPAVETTLPEAPPEFPEDMHEELIRQVRDQVQQRPVEPPLLNPATGLVIPPFAELLELVVRENLYVRVDRLLRDAQQPAIRKAYDRMVIGGYPPPQAQELLTRIYAAAQRAARENGQPFDAQAYAREVSTLTGGDEPA